MVLQWQGEPYYVYSCRVIDMQETSQNPESTWPPFLPGRHQLLNPIDPKTNTRLAIGHVNSVQFSEDSKLIALLSQPSGFNTQVFYGWSWNETKRKYSYVNRITFTRPVRFNTTTQYISSNED
jgi:hypothetical protein